jgi:hypothetical protein
MSTELKVQPEYRPLTSPFRRDKFDWFIEKRVGDVVLLKQVETTGSFNWVVALVQKHRESLAFGRTIEAYEGLPTTNKWGVHAWTYTPSDKGKELAEKKFTDKVSEAAQS